MRTIRVGSRESRLAVVQAQIVMADIEKQNPGIQLELVTMKTTGDKILHKTLDKIGGKGLFVKELDEALAEGRVDICVHSYKDMPMDDNPDFPVVAASKREDPRDVLIFPDGQEEPWMEAPLGCSSLRRQLQLKALFPGWRCEPVRGNVLTRLDKLDRGEFGGLVLAAAGMRRLRLWDRVSRIFDEGEILPAACQGILAIQARKGEDLTFLDRYNDMDAWDAAVAERAFVRALDGGCSSPVAAHAQIHGNELLLTGLYVAAGDTVLKKQMRGTRDQADQIGKELAAQLVREGEQYE